MKKKIIFRGVGTALITPMKNGEIDYPALSRIIELQISAGVGALIVGGTTAEAATLTDEERRELYTYVKAQVNGRTKIILGTGTNDTRVALAHTKTANEIGCDGILVVTPYYNKGTHRGVVEHYKAIADCADMPVMLYNVPARTGVNLTISQLEELAKCENITGLKEASDSADRLTELAKFGDDLTLYAGNDSQIYLTLALGGAGVVSVASNLYPERLVSLCDSFKKGDTGAALATQIELLGFIKALFIETNPSPIKYAMSLAGLCSPEVRSPLYIPEEQSRQLIEEEMRKLSGKS